MSPSARGSYKEVRTKQKTHKKTTRLCLSQLNNKGHGQQLCQESEAEIVVNRDGQGRFQKRMWNKHSEEIQLILEPKAKGLITASNWPSGSGPFYLSALVSYPSPACFLSSCPYWSPHCPLSVSSIYLLHLLSESLFLQIASCFSPLVPSGLCSNYHTRKAVSHHSF